MGDFLIPAVVLGVIALLMAAVPSVVLVRRLFLARGVTSFDCSWRPGPGMGSWAYGLARYESDRLEWYRLFALSLRPTWAAHRLPSICRAAPE